MQRNVTPHQSGLDEVIAASEQEGRVLDPWEKTIMDVKKQVDQITLQAHAAFAKCQVPKASRDAFLARVVREANLAKEKKQFAQDDQPQPSQINIKKN